MSNVTVSPNELSKAVGDIIQEYSDEVVRAMPDAVKKAAKEGVKSLKKHASSIGGTKYKTSFKSKKTKSTSSNTEYTLYSTQYRVAHLLEKSHPIRNQTGLIYGMSMPREHWAPAEKEAIEALEKEINKKVEDAG